MIYFYKFSRWTSKLPVYKKALNRWAITFLNLLNHSRTSPLSIQINALVPTTYSRLPWLISIICFMHHEFFSTLTYKKTTNRYAAMRKQSIHQYYDFVLWNYIENKEISKLVLCWRDYSVLVLPLKYYWGKAKWNGWRNIQDESFYQILKSNVSIELNEDNF